MTALRIAIAGLGTVGAGTVDLLQRNMDRLTERAGKKIEIVAVSARDPEKARECDISLLNWVSDPMAFATMDNVDVVVEMIGGSEGVARELCFKALENGKHVVTSNKALLANHAFEMAKIAEAKNVRLMYEAAVAGGVPVIKTLRDALAGNGMSAVKGILNGTCNVILTRMGEDGFSFDEALEEAQEFGFAEEDPSADVDGHDTAHKLTLLAALAFGIAPNLSQITTEGIRQISPVDIAYAEMLGYKIKLLGAAHLTDEGVDQHVGPCLVPAESTLGQTDGVMNAILLEGDAVGDMTLVGEGAGAHPTASAIVADIVDLARGYQTLPFAIPVANLDHKPAVSAPKSGWYIRLFVEDKIGVLADLSAILRDEKISVESLVQQGDIVLEDDDEDDFEVCVPVIMTTHPVEEDALRRAVAKMTLLPSVKSDPCILRVEEA